MSALPCPEGGGAQHNKLCKLASGQMPQHSKAMPGCNRRLLPQPVQVQGCDRRSLPACTTCCAALPRPLGRGAQTYVHRLLRVAAKREGRRKLLRVGTKSQNREYSSVGRALPLQGRGQGFESLYFHPSIQHSQTICFAPEEGVATPTVGRQPGDECRQVKDRDFLIERNRCDQKIILLLLL